MIRGTTVKRLSFLSHPIIYQTAELSVHRPALETTRLGAKLQELIIGGG